jgi:tRNA threonylcarbamoyladenosine biosynthesis protein TsaE
MKKIEYSIDQIDKVAQKFVQDIKKKQVITFTGGLGAGKTTFIQAVLRQMGVLGPIASPTFTYFNQYQAAGGRTVYHFDIYRLKNAQEFEAAGFFDYLYQPESIVFIEWPEIIDALLKNDVCRAKLSVLDDTNRLLEYDLLEV